MSDELSTERLEAVLISIGRHLEIPPAPTTAPYPVTPHRRGRPGPLLVAAAVVALVVGGIVLVPSTRAAIADLLGIGSTRIEITPEAPIDQTGLPHVAQHLTQITVDEAVTILGRPLPDTSGTALGRPEAVYRMPEGGVLLAWRDGTATLWVRAAADPAIIFRKLIGSSERIETVDDLGLEALIITGEHLLVTPQRRLAAQQVLLWYDDTHEYRLEADLAPADLVDIARQLD